MDVTLRVTDGVISDATYETYLCPASHDCGKAVCALVKGRSTEEARAVDYNSVVRRVGPLPRTKTSCYGLAVLALAAALAQLEKQ